MSVHVTYKSQTSSDKSQNFRESWDLSVHEPLYIIKFHGHSPELDIYFRYIMGYIIEYVHFPLILGICQGVGGIYPRMNTNMSKMESHISQFFNIMGFVCDVLGYVGVIVSWQDHFKKVTSSSGCKVGQCGQSWDTCWECRISGR